MSVEETSTTELQDDQLVLWGLATRLWAWMLLIAMGACFLLIGGGNLDLGAVEAKLGIAASEGFGPMGQVGGGWEPAIWPAQLAPSVLWAWGEWPQTTSASVRWPAAIAGLIAGLILARRAMAVLGLRAAILVGLCWFGSIALIDRSGGASIDLIAGLATVAALDRILGRGSDFLAGCWAALAFLSAGWPPLALIVLSTIVIGRRDTVLSFRLIAMPVVAFAVWSVWALSMVPSEAWAAAIALPLTQKSAWLLPLGVVGLGLPWSPFALFAFDRSIREGWPEAGRSLVIGWLQVAGACLLVGTIIPGLATAAVVPALAGLAVTAGAACDRLWTRNVSALAARGFVAIAMGIVLFWIGLAILAGVYLGAAIPYYRTLAVALNLALLPLAAVAIRTVSRSDPRRAVIALAIVAFSLKLAHWGYYVPEWNYRRSQGPWGRAIGQWVPPRWPVYTTHTWQPDLAFALGRPVRQLVHPKSLGLLPGSETRHVLLLASEFEHWPEDAPHLVVVATFNDEHGDQRVLARTAGEFSWKLARQVPRY